MKLNKVLGFFVLLTVTSVAYSQSTYNISIKNAVFTVLHELSTIENLGSRDGAAIVYALFMRNLDLDGIDQNEILVMPREGYNELREDLLHDLIEIDGHLKRKSWMAVLQDFYPLGNRYEPVYSYFETAKYDLQFRNINHQRWWENLN